MSTLVDNFYNAVDRGMEGKNISVSIGLPKLETQVEGFSQGVSYLIAAGSGVGKTTLLLYSFIYKPIMDHYLHGARDVRFLYFNLEMTEDQIFAKLLSIYIYETYGVELSFKDIFSRGKDNILSEDNRKIIEECRPILELFSNKIVFESGKLNANLYDNKVIAYLKKHGEFKDRSFISNNSDIIHGIVVDHLNLVRASSGRSKKEEIDAISNHSVTFRNECNVSPINLMQFNRNSSGQERLKQGLQEPDESDLKETGTVYEDSMVALTMFSPVKAKLSSHRGYDIKQLGNSYRSIKCIKNRFGSADFAVGLGFYGKIGIFKELPKSNLINNYEKYTTPDWCLNNIKDNIKNKDDIKFIM